MFANSFFKTMFPVRYNPRGVGLCESLNLGHRVVSSCQLQHRMLSSQGMGTGQGCGPKKNVEPSDGVMERPSCH